VTGGRVVAIAVIWAMAAGLMISNILDAPHAALLAACATAAVLVRPGQESDVANLPPPPYYRHPGAHGDLADLSWCVFDIDGAVSDRALVRVRALAVGTPRLAALRRVIDSCHHPSAHQVIGWLEIIKQEQGAM